MIMLPALLRFITKDKDLIPDGMGDTAILTSAANAIRKMDKSQQTATMTQLVGVSPELAMILGSRLGEPEPPRKPPSKYSQDKAARVRELNRRLFGEYRRRPGHPTDRSERQGIAARLTRRSGRRRYRSL